MIVGEVISGEARIRLTIKGLRGSGRDVEGVVDTGYTGSLTLPPVLVAELGLRWRSLDRGTLADGSECLFDVYEAKVVWDGSVRDILVDEADTDPLVGMRLLRDHELNVQVRAGGKVTIKRLGPS